MIIIQSLRRRVRLGDQRAGVSVAGADGQGRGRRAAGGAARRVPRAAAGHAGELLPTVPAGGGPGAGPVAAHRRGWPHAAAADGQRRRRRPADQEGRQVVLRERRRWRLRRQRWRCT